MYSINLFAGPCCGKSTLAMYLAYRFKSEKYNSELILEFAKDLTYEKAYNILENQIFIFGQQQHRMYRCKDDVDIIICDSPLLLGLQYAKDDIKHHLENLVLLEHNKYENINLFINRNTDYVSIGRNQTLEEAVIIDNNIKDILNRNSIDYFTVDYPLESEENIYQKIKKIINEK